MTTLTRTDLRNVGRTAPVRLFAMAATAVIAGTLIAGSTDTSALAADSHSVVTGPTAGGTTVELDTGEFGFVDVQGTHLGAYALSAGGEIFSWGLNSYGQLGDGSTSRSVAPSYVHQGDRPDGVMFTAVAGYNSSGYGLGTDNQIYAWGNNTNGALGDGTTEHRVLPVAVAAGAIPEDVTIVSIAAGMHAGYALGDDNRVYAWGDNTNGALGDGTTENSLVPVAVDLSGINSSPHFTEISAGNNRVHLRASNGVVYTWGDNTNGALGDGTTEHRLTPVTVAAGEIPAGTTIAQLSRGDNSTYAIGTDGLVYSWGSNSDGQLGNGTTKLSSSPVAVALPEGVTVRDIAGGVATGIALGDNGQLYTWGSNDSNLLGTGGKEVSVSTPVAVDMSNIPEGVEITGIAAGHLTGFAIGANHRTYPWGSHADGASGSGTRVAYDIPAIGPHLVINKMYFDDVEGSKVVTTDTGVSSTAPAHPEAEVDITALFTAYAATQISYVKISILTFPTRFLYTDRPMLTGDALPGAFVNDEYSERIGVKGAGADTYTRTDGALPAGLTLDEETGAITGVPTTAGTSTFTISVANDIGTDTREFTLEISAPIVPLDPTIDPELTLPMPEVEPEGTLPMPTVEPELTLPMPEVEPEITFPMPTVEPELTLPMPEVEPEITFPMPEVEPEVTLPMPTVEPELTLPMPEVEPELTLPMPTVEPEVTLPMPTLDPESAELPGYPSTEGDTGSSATDGTDESAGGNADGAGSGLAATGTALLAALTLATLLLTTGAMLWFGFFARRRAQSADAAN